MSAYHELRSIHGDANAQPGRGFARRRRSGTSRPWYRRSRWTATSSASTATSCPERPRRTASSRRSWRPAGPSASMSSWLEAAPPPFGRGPALRFPDQARFHPLRYLAGLSRAIRSRGGSIVRARAEGLGGDENEVLVRTEQGPTVRAKTLVVATHAPVHQSLGVHLKQAPYRTYVVAFRVEKGIGPARALLGHRRSLPLRAHRRGGRRHGRLGDRGRRRPQAGAGRPRGRALLAARELGARPHPPTPRDEGPVVGTGPRAGRRSGFHRPEQRLAERLPRHRLQRQRDHLRRDRGPAPVRPHRQGWVGVERPLRPLAPQAQGRRQLPEGGDRRGRPLRRARHRGRGVGCGRDPARRRRCRSAGG